MMNAFKAVFWSFFGVRKRSDHERAQLTLLHYGKGGSVVLTGAHAARNWIGVVGALLADLMLQFFGVGAFLLPVFPAVLGARWFRSRRVQYPIAKSLGGIWLVIFVPALLALLRTRHTSPSCANGAGGGYRSA